MDSKNYRKIEAMLYNYYRRKKKIYRLKGKLIRTQNRIDRLRKDIKECNIEIDHTIKAIDYSNEKIKCNDVTSSIERELERAIDKLFRDLEFNIRDKRKINEKIRYLEKKVDDLDVVLEQLTDEELQIVELKYGEEMNYREMEVRLPMARSTIQRKKDRIIEYLINEME